MCVFVNVAKIDFMFKLGMNTSFLVFPPCGRIRAIKTLLNPYERKSYQVIVNYNNIEIGPEVNVLS